MISFGLEYRSAVDAKEVGQRKQNTNRVAVEMTGADLDIDKKLTYQVKKGTPYEYL